MSKPPTKVLRIIVSIFIIFNFISIYNYIIIIFINKIIYIRLVIFYVEKVWQRNNNYNINTNIK